MSNLFVFQSPDQVDLNVNVEEQHSGTSTLAVGYSKVVVLHSKQG
jgi:outer membrane protein assembly factor BamA